MNDLYQILFVYDGRYCLYMNWYMNDQNQILFVYERSIPDIVRGI